jgi:hypothetical protein
MARYNISAALAVVTALGLSLSTPAAFGAPVAAAPYVFSVFAKAPKGLSAPDSIAVVGGHVFVGYGDGHKPDGSDGLSSQVVEFSPTGSVVHIYTVPGHNDGLKVDPSTGLLWALQNEDAKPNLVVINPVTGKTKSYKFGPTLHGGGYDDIVFLNGKVYISASNPAKNPNTGPAIVAATLGIGTVSVKPILSGSAEAIDLLTDKATKLNLQDPDSMTVNPSGDIVLDSQADQELVIVSAVGKANQTVLRLPLSYKTKTGATPGEVDDTAFVTSTKGLLLFADKKLNTVYAVKRHAFSPGTAFSSADNGPFVGSLDLTSGVITPIVTGLGNPGGLVFVSTGN